MATYQLNLKSSCKEAGKCVQELAAAVDEMLATITTTITTLIATKEHKSKQYSKKMENGKNDKPK